MFVIIISKNKYMSETQWKWGLPNDCNQHTFREIAHNHHNALLVEADSRNATDCDDLRWLGQEAMEHDNLVKLAHINKQLCAALGLHSIRQLFAGEGSHQLAMA